MDKLTLFLIIALIFFGLVMVYSSSTVSTILRYDKPTYYFFVRQAIYYGVGIIFGFIFILNFPLKNYKTISYPLLVLFFVILLLLLIYGKTTHEVRRSIDLVFFKFQPSEFFKIIFIMFAATYYNYLNKIKESSFYLYLVPFIASSFAAMLVFFQPDLGSAVIIFLLGFLIFLSTPVKTRKNKRNKIFVALGVILLLLVAYNAVPKILSERQIKRFDFAKPCQKYQDDSGYQVCNAFIAIKNGGLYGVGFNNSTQKHSYLPESHTDFIFPIIVEETGFLGGGLVLVLYMILLFRIYIISRKSVNLQISILSYGIFLIFTLHILINLLGVLAIIPLTGVPLPFLSYGGSSSLMFLFLFFILQAAYNENTKIKINRRISTM